jgi:mitofusin
VKQQHLERTVSFLCNELSVMEPHEAEERVFFTSALESLDSSSSGSQTPTRLRLNGWESRLIEFNKFERKFEASI